MHRRLQRKVGVCDNEYSNAFLLRLAILSSSSSDEESSSSFSSPSLFSAVPAPSTGCFVFFFFGFLAESSGYGRIHSRACGPISFY